MRISCPRQYLNVLRNQLKPVNRENTFFARITMLEECSHLDLGNRCDLTGTDCIFKELPKIENIDFDEEDYFRESLF